jgi:hypothetical protein
MQKLKEEEISPIVIDLTNGDKLDESWLRMLGFGVKSILNSMFGGSSVPVSVTGNRSEVTSFAKAIGKEKRYMDSLRRYGLDNPKTFKNKSMLDKATSAFTRKTGLKWPFK